MYKVMIKTGKKTHFDKNIKSLDNEVDAGLFALKQAKAMRLNDPYIKVSLVEEQK